MHWRLRLSTTSTETLELCGERLSGKESMHDSESAGSKTRIEQPTAGRTDQSRQHDAWKRRHVDGWRLLRVALLQTACYYAARSQLTKTQNMRSMKEIASVLTNYHAHRTAQLSPAAMLLGTAPSSRIPTKFSAMILTRKGTISLRT